MNDVRIGLKGLRPDGTLEVPGGLTGWLVVDNGAVVGKMEVIGSEMHFKWSSSTAAWPSSFELEKPAGHSVPSLPVNNKYEHQAFSGSSSSHDVTGCDYEIKDGSTTIAWMKVNSANTEWYGVPAYVSGGYLLIGGSSLTFEANSATGNKTAYKLVDIEL